MRFKSLSSREAPPTETVPFETYERWLRFQHGTVTGFDDGDAYIHFEPTDRAAEDGRERREWTALRWAVRLRLAELELVVLIVVSQDRWVAVTFRRPTGEQLQLSVSETRRSPAIGSGSDEWEAVRGTLRWKPTAFGDAAGN